jgi:hypothetical protein
MKSQISNFQHSSPRTKNQGRTFSYAYAAAAAAVTAPLGAPGNERVECDGGLHVRWDYEFSILNVLRRMPWHLCTKIHPTIRLYIFY